MGVPVFYQGSKYKPVPFVPIPVPPTPHVSAAEVGNVNASTVAVTFDTGIDAAGNDFSSGVTIKVNASVRAFESGIRQSNHAIVYYALATPVVNGDTVTWEYTQSSGHIVAESGGATLGDVAAQSVTNNVLPAPLLDLEADTQSLGALATWTGEEPDHHAFAQATEAAQPTVQMVGGYKAVNLTSSVSFMEGADFADNLASATFIVVISNVTTNGQLICVMSKLNDYFTGQGWLLGADFLFTQEAGGNVYLQVTGDDPDDPNGKHIFTNEKISNTEIHNYRDGVLYSPITSSNGTVANFSNNLTVLIGTNHAQDSWCGGNFYAIRIYTPALSPTDRAAVEAELAARYGITL